MSQSPTETGDPTWTGAAPVPRYAEGSGVSTGSRGRTRGLDADDPRLVQAGVVTKGPRGSFTPAIGEESQEP